MVLYIFYLKNYHRELNYIISKRKNENLHSASFVYLNYLRRSVAEINNPSGLIKINVQSENMDKRLSKENAAPIWSFLVDYKKKL